MPRTRRAPDCPVCGTADARRIVYGMPTVQLLEDDDVAIGGCIVWEDRPRFRCRNVECEHEFGARIAAR